MSRNFSVFSWVGDGEGPSLVMIFVDNSILRLCCSLVCSVFSKGHDFTRLQWALPAAVRSLVLHSSLTPPVVEVEEDNLPPMTFSSMSRTRSMANCSRV